MENLHSSTWALLDANDDMLIKQVLQTHSPSDCHIDPRPQLHLTEAILNCIRSTPGVHKSIVVEAYINNIVDNDDHGVGATHMDKELMCTIHTILYKMSKDRYKDVDKHGATMGCLELLGYHSWDVKVVAVLAALVLNYGQFSLIRHLYEGRRRHPLAFSVAVLKGLTLTTEYSMEMVRCFKALDVLIEALLDVARCIVELGCLALSYVPMDRQEMQAVQPSIHLAVYWVVRTSVVCTCQLTSIMTERQTSLVLATWELWTYVCKVKGIQRNMKKGLDFCYVRSKETLQSIFEEVQEDNEKVLSRCLSQNHSGGLTLLARGSSSEKIELMSALGKRVVVLVISRPDVPLEKLLLLVERLQNRSAGEEPQGQYETAWVPIPRSMACSPLEELAFTKLADAVPCYSVCYPWLLSRSIIEHVKEQWVPEDELALVVLGSKGETLSLNAIDMVLIWGGPQSYPFSNSREEQLWDGASLTLEFLVDKIDHHLSRQMTNARIVCLFGSTDMDWIRELSKKVKLLTEVGLRLLLVYVGSCSNAHVTDVAHLIYYEKLSYCLSHQNMNIFWLRLESMQRSRLRLGCNSETDAILTVINSLMKFEIENQSWAIISEGPSADITMLDGKRSLELFSLYETWERDVEKMGILGALRHALNPPPPAEHCGNCFLIPFNKASHGIASSCEVCGGPMEKHIVYQCSTKGS